jgi:hypothetical protein
MIRFAVIFCLAIAPLSGVFALQQDSTALTVSNQQEELINKQDKEKKDKKQLKPMSVKPNVKVKPIKIIKPKIKRP